MMLSKTKVSTRLSVGFLLVLALLTISLILSLNRMSSMQDKIEEVVNVNNAQLAQMSELRVALYDRMVAARNVVMLSDPAEMKPEIERMRLDEKISDEAISKLKKLYDQRPQTSEEEKAALARISKFEADIAPVAERAMMLGQQNRVQEATRVLLDEVRPVQRKIMAEIDRLVGIQNKLSEKAARDALSSYETARWVLIVLGAVALMLGTIAALVITRSITKQLGGEPTAAAEVATRIAAGDLEVVIHVDGSDQSSLMFAMKGMRDRLAEIVRNVRTGTDTIATASSQIAAGNLDLSSRTEQQASSLEETASSMEELTSTVRQNAENAGHANQLAINASDVATRGGDVVSEVVQTMEQINESARKIVDIISVIDGIAFQTNILALNAAVEAARAGEQGRGFAVVASEVRSLAQRSAAAAKEIKVLIGDSVGKVENGSKLVAEAGTTMTEVVSSVRRVTEIMAEITAASKEQSNGIEQVNQAITQMDQVTQQNAALVEEAAAAADSLQEQAAALSDIVSVFRIAGSAPVQTASRRPVRALKSPMPQAKTSPARTAVSVTTASSSPKLAASNGSSGAPDDWEEF